MAMGQGLRAEDILNEILFNACATNSSGGIETATIQMHCVWFEIKYELVDNQSTPFKYRIHRFTEMSTPMRHAFGILHRDNVSSVIKLQIEKGE